MNLDRSISLEASLNTASHDIDHGGDLTITSLLFGPRLSGRFDRDLVLYAGAGLGIYPIDYDNHWHNGYYYRGHSETRRDFISAAGWSFR